MVCTTSIIYHKKVYTPGEIVTGWVALQTTTAILVEEIVLILDKKSGIQIEEPGESNISNEKSTRHLGRFLIYTDRTRQVLPGIHKFPFSFRLVGGEGATVSYTKSTEERKISMFNRYITRCEVRIYGIFKPVSKTYKEISLTEKSTEAPARTTHKESRSACFCLFPLEDVFLDLDSVLYAGNKHLFELYTTEGATFTRLEASIEMVIAIDGDSLLTTAVTFPCKVEKRGESFFFELEGTLPSDTSANDFFSISYNLTISAISSSGKVVITRRVSVRSKKMFGDYTLPDVLESATCASLTPAFSCK
ncbi:hypothetical protein NEDG_01286 [Nematocida displodere]|uniref:Arrestin-like N-terminal domain-containing protein n=1 Tax=Nematocida displodere TaxID=1805483 RepID=A0A177EB87_9MICR|nr:hypothetical protein NEDG_01286 [Nematocida displodere]